MADCVLPQEIIMSILSRLPVNSLVRLKVVCKPWQRLVTNQEFIKLHYNQFSEAPKTCRGNSRKLLSRYSPRIPHNNKLLVGVTKSRPADFYLATCRGLIFMAWPQIISSIRTLIWNPATRLWKLLPHPATNHPGTAVPACMRFGCNEEGDDHKVVRIQCVEMKAYVEVYSSKSDSWGMLNVGFPFQPLLLGDVAVVNGNPHWIVHDEAEEMVLLRLDATSMLFSKIGLHEVMKGEDQISFVDLGGGILGGLHCVNREGDLLERVDVWEHVKEEWVLKWRIEEAPLRALQVEIFQDYSWREGKIVGRCKNGSLFEYQLKGGRLRLRVFGVERGRRGLLQMRAYEESLAYVRGMEAMSFDTPAVVGDDEIQDCISEGFLTWATPRVVGKEQIYYPLAF